ncbi:MAG TPA: VOC family protein [Candidatus Acidoferrum sp.]|jgi:catechol 2,3-dioxygenase-like lactoylglutathione lyase family enzyme|nr:VOC family protein [Candidatus Acidoferrum sp.]
MKMVLTTLPFILCLGLASSRRPDVEDRPALLGKPNGSFYALLVPQANEAAEWYRDYLGFSVIRSTEGPGGTSRTIMLAQQGVLLEIIEARGSFNLQSVTNKKTNLLQGIRKVGIVIEGEDFDRLHSALVRKKATFIGDVFTDHGLKMRSFIVRDTSGNLVQFFSRVKS